MISLGTQPVPVPEVRSAPAGALRRGSVYVLNGNADPPTSQLLDGKRAVLTVANGQAVEVTTRATIGPVVEIAGTYLDGADVAALGVATGATLRSYTWRDTAAKIRSRAGLLVLAPAVFALLTAAASVYFALAASGDTGPSTAATAQAAVLWLRQPLDAAPSGTADPSQLGRRLTQVSICLQELAGQPSTGARIPHVDCAAEAVPWYRSSTAGALVTGAIALLTAGIGVIALNGRYGFGKSPDG
jgi:hypothetical protein